MNNEDYHKYEDDILDNLYLELYTKEVEEISLDAKNHTLENELDNLYKLKYKMKKKKNIFFKKIHNLPYNLIICLLLIGYINLFIDKIRVSTAALQNIYLASILIGVPSICVLSAVVFSKIEKNIKIKKEIKYNNIIKQIEEITNILNQNRQILLDITKEKEIITDKIVSIKPDAWIRGLSSSNNLEEYHKENNIQSNTSKPYTRVKTKDKYKKNI